MQARAKRRPIVSIGSEYTQLEDEPFWTKPRVKKLAVFLAIIAILFLIFWIWWVFFQSPPPVVFPPSPPPGPTQPMRALGSACCEMEWTTNQSLQCRPWVCGTFGSKQGLGDNGKCGSFDESNDYYSFGIGRPMHFENGEYSTYASQTYAAYTAAIAAGNATPQSFTVDGINHAWEAGDDPRFFHRCCPNTKRGVSSKDGLCLDLPLDATCQDPRQAGAYPPQQSAGDAYVTGLFCGWVPLDPTIEDPNPVSLLYNPLHAIRNGKLAAGKHSPFESESASIAKDRRIEIAQRMKITRPSYWGKLGSRGSLHSEYSHSRIEIGRAHV